MAADIEAKSLILDGARQPADIVRIGLEDFGTESVARQLIACGQAGRACADDHCLMRIVSKRQARVPRPTLGRREAKGESTRYCEGFLGIHITQTKVMKPVKGLLREFGTQLRREPLSSLGRIWLRVSGIFRRARKLGGRLRRAMRCSSHSLITGRRSFG